MKTFLVFNEEKDPFDRLKLKRALTADDAYIVLWYMQMWFRNKFKYEDKKYTKTQLKALEDAAFEFRRLLEEYEVSLDNLE
jgi:hypothetical protein